MKDNFYDDQIVSYPIQTSIVLYIDKYCYLIQVFPLYSLYTTHNNEWNEKNQLIQYCNLFFSPFVFASLDCSFETILQAEQYAPHALQYNAAQLSRKIFLAVFHIKNYYFKSILHV